MDDSKTLALGLMGSSDILPLCANSESERFHNPVVSVNTRNDIEDSSTIFIFEANWDCLIYMIHGMYE